MIDLHIHTTNSDGTDTVKEILQQAQDLSLEYISITDHDNCDSYDELEKMDVKQIYSGKIIPGIEIKCSYKGRLIEVLGYKIKIKKMKDWINVYYKDKQRYMVQMKYFNHLYEQCIKLELTMSKRDEIIWNPKKDWASFTIYNDMKNYEINKDKLPQDLWDDFTTFTKKYCGNPKESWYIDKTKDYPSLEEAIKAIKDCEGLVFLPHLFIYKWAENKEDFIKELISNYEIDGIECYHSTFKEENIEYLLNLTSERKLLRSGGSDYHGENKPTIKLAVGKGNLKIESSLVKEWVGE